jgi:hypothetical protein
MALLDVVRQDSVTVTEFVTMGFDHERTLSDSVAVADAVFAVFDQGRIPFRADLERTDFLTATVRRTEIL